MVEGILEDVSNFMAGYSVYFSFQPPKRNAVKLSYCFCPKDVITGPWPVHTPLTALQSTHDVKCPWCYKTNQIGGRKINVQPSSNFSKNSYEISGKKKPNSVILCLHWKWRSCRWFSKSFLALSKWNLCIKGKRKTGCLYVSSSLLISYSCWELGPSIFLSLAFFPKYSLYSLYNHFCWGCESGSGCSITIIN